MQRVREIVDSGELGKVLHLVGSLAVPSVLSPLFFLKDDIRFQYALGGGCTMDMGSEYVSSNCAAIVFNPSSSQFTHLRQCAI